MKKILYWIGIVFLFVSLTVLTQVGGIILVLSLLCSKLGKDFRCKRSLYFIVIYLCTSLILIPFLAPKFGRVPISSSVNNLKPVNFATVLLNRNYVRPELNTILINSANELSKVNSEIEMRYLDACFPFFDGFPLLPHLSHKDGKKVDLSFVYEDGKGVIQNKSKSISGYGVFVEPLFGEENQCQKCMSLGYKQYDMTKYATLGTVNHDLQFSTHGTKTLIEVLLKQPIGKLFIEPNLKKRMHLHDSRIRFQGCRSVRHDDHIHIQL